MIDYGDLQRLTKWLSDFVLEFRKRYSTLSDAEKGHIVNSDDYLAPCQLEIFWMRNPEWQFLVTTHSKDRKDLEIIVNGPYEAYRFLDEIEKIMEEERN